MEQGHEKKGRFQLELWKKGRLRIIELRRLKKEKKCVKA